MKSRRTGCKRKGQGSLVLRRLIKGFILLVFIVVTFLFVSFLWKEPVVAPDQSLNDVMEDEEIQEAPEIAEPTEPPLPTPEEIQVMEEERLALEEERIRLENLELEKGYYKSTESSEVAISSEWILIPSTVAPGDVLLVRHHESNEIIWAEKTYELKQFGTGFYAYLPIASNTAPGEYKIGDQTLIVEEKSFKTQYLEVSSEMESMRRDRDRIHADQLKINQARSQSSAEFLFSSDSEFVQPIEGRLSTPFGYTRYINGSLSGRHMAIDLAAPEGTPIMTTNEGIVVLADELYLTGNAVYIDHGMGLFSQYAHLSELNVETGDRVEQGEIIGLVGTTGFSTGPHLHFTFWAHNVPVNPNLFFGKTPFHWLEETPHP